MLAPEASSGDTNASMRPSAESARWLASSCRGMENSRRSAGLGLAGWNRNTERSSRRERQHPGGKMRPASLRRDRGFFDFQLCNSEIPLDSRIQSSCSFKSCALCGRSSDPLPGTF